ncbi:efflux RND transporter permease subunit [Sandaracinus amylolyticus]|uniref:efflux RND transporter permease subunit n=1 Tax=Sandaracinus amylolyticus TaxID=927083 RepID=UPI001F21B5FD|nr:efflux RND transporter permease subunit [Sandaracinus amylolyticus]UJR79527.1 SSD domain-containing protein [Sandaracinus amylolyticus]
MNWGALSIRRGVTTAMVYLCLTGFGLFTLYNLPVNRLPDVEFPVVAIVTNYVGASPEDMETLVTSPIERAVASVENVERVRSISRPGTSIVIVSFTWGTDMDFAEVEVRKNIELFAGDFLPEEATRPLTFAFDPSLAPVVFMAVEGPMDAHRLREISSDEIQPFLARQPGVAAAEVIGGLAREIQVRLHPIWLQANGISPSQVVDALRAANAIVPAGGVDDGTQLLFIQPTSTFRSVAEIEDVIVGARGGRPVLLREVAEVVDTFEEQTRVVTADGHPAVLLAVRKQSDANTVQVSRAVHDAMPALRAQLPEGVEVTPLFDEAESILRAIGNLGDSANEAFWLTAIVLLLFLRSWRASLINVLAVPASIFVAFVAMSALGVTLNLVSMAGLVLAIGMIVDNATVVLESTFQNIEKGIDPAKAATMAVEEMTMPIVAATLTTVVVFLPILLVEGIAGELFRDMVLTICASMLASLVVAVTLVPLMSAKMLGTDHTTRFAKALTRATAWIDAMGPAYERGLVWCTRNPWKVVVMASVAFVASCAVVPFLGRDFLPHSDVADIRIEVTAAPGISLSEMRRRVEHVEQVIRDEVPELQVVTADFGTAQGISAIFGATANTGTMRVRLPPRDQRERSQQEIERALTERFADIPGLDIEIQTLAIGGGAGGDVEVKIFGDDLGDVRRFGEVLRDELSSVEGVRDARFSMGQGSPELQVEFDRERMRVLGLAPAQVAGAIAAYYQGVPATAFREGGDEHTIRVRAAREHREDLDALRYLPIPLATGATIPLGSVARVGDRLGTTDIERENQRRYATVFISMGEADLGTLTTRIEERIAALGVPSGIRTEIGGAAADLRDAFFKLALALGAALALVYMVMAAEFESLLEPLVIMATVPLAIIGVVLALAVTGTSLQVTALVGVILLGGIVVANGIVLIDVLKRRRAEGVDLVEATLEAGRTRLRPILMTALTTIVGMVPPALGTGDGAEIWAPLGRAVVGGLTVSTLLTLFVVPVLYVLLAGWIDRRKARRAKPSEPAPSEPMAETPVREAAE